MEKNLEEIASRIAPDVAKSLNSAARIGGTEADFRREVARILEEAGSEAGLTIVPRDEFSVARGRVDSVYNRLILEYKRPGVLGEKNSKQANRDVIQQVKDYILDVGKKEKREAQRLAGVATDGFFFIFVRRVGEGWDVEDPSPVNKSTTETFLRLLFALGQGAALVPEILVQDFGPKHMRTQAAVRAIYRAFVSSKNPLVKKLFEQWRQFFSEATDYKEWSQNIESKPEFRSFVKSLWTTEEIKRLDAASVFFVLHTYYALLIKLIAALAAGRFVAGKVAALSNLAAKEGDDLREAFVDLERGGLFREYGIRNFLEGDFFGWYLAAWNDDIEDAVGSLIKRLAEYDPGTLELAPENARDLLKKLYHYLLPREIRHDLGEYYTPDWLAERLCIQTIGSDLGDPRIRVLDPACGSGTFLVILIKRIKERAATLKMSPNELLESILHNIVGFDLNPLAVIAARTNYLLALGDLLRQRKGDIDIPVYQCDSVMTPAQGEELFDREVHPLVTSVGVFRVPSIFARRERMDALADTLDECVEASVTPNSFVERLRKDPRITVSDVDAVEAELSGLYKQLQELHDAGLNGVWARIIKNAFAPLFVEQCTYVVGNPPWVNWENLPEEYRRRSIPLWQHYGLFPRRTDGLDTILGAAKYDISALMTYVSLDKYLVRRGRLGFVLTESLFKTTAAGQGFRRFLLPDKTPVPPFLVEDFVTLKPFEDTANRTVVAIFSKDREISYPVPYSYWVKKGRGRGSSIGFDTPYETVTAEKITFRAWKAKPVDKDDPTSIWITGRTKAIQTVERLLGRSEYQAREGVNTGGANGVFWVELTGNRPGGLVMVSNIAEGSIKKIQSVQAAIEPKLLYPLLRGGDVKRWLATPNCQIVLTHEPGMRLIAIPEERMQGELPKTYAYLKRFEDSLRNRKTQIVKHLMENGPFYSMFAIGDYTFAPWKVVWTRIAKVEAAVCGTFDGKPCVPQETITLVSCQTEDEAHFICAVINSSPFQFALNSYSQRGGKSMGSPHILEYLKIPLFSKSTDLHRNLAKLSICAHKAALSGESEQLIEAETEVDELARQLWGLSREELEETKESLEEL